MAVEVIDAIARQEIADHETVGNPHAQYSLSDGSTTLDKIRLSSPDGSVWELSVNNNGILVATKL